MLESIQNLMLNKDIYIIFGYNLKLPSACYKRLDKMSIYGSRKSYYYYTFTFQYIEHMTTYEYKIIFRIFKNRKDGWRFSQINLFFFLLACIYRTTTREHFALRVKNLKNIFVCFLSRFVTVKKISTNLMLVL